VELLSGAIAIMSTDTGMRTTITGKAIKPETVE
jgi:hypothetical protein